MIKNRHEIYDIVSKLLVERQTIYGKQNAVDKDVHCTSSADELMKYKELLDSGVLTQKEFDAKKKQLLGL